MLANAEDVVQQVLAGHGPTTQFKLLLGNARSTLDKIAAGLQITSLFEMDFAPGGTNIPHRHAREEEIYYVRSGHGEMVAGNTPEGKVARHARKEGDAFYFPPGTLVGFYSGAKEGEKGSVPNFTSWQVAEPNLIEARCEVWPSGRQDGNGHGMTS